MLAISLHLGSVYGSHCYALHEKSLNWEYAYVVAAKRVSAWKDDSCDSGLEIGQELPQLLPILPITTLKEWGR